ncbi:MAG: DNA-3-methyladenine glycosylase I, partial [Candidatus Macondimonas sp.]
FGSFDRYIWDFVDGRPIVNHFERLDQVPAVTPLAETLSRDLKQRGFRFVGPTIVYAHMQATGMVNDHLLDCPRHAACAALA